MLSKLAMNSTPSSIQKFSAAQLCHVNRILSITILAFTLLLILFNSNAVKAQTASPDWSKQSIYFVMIDRFSDGNSDNNDFGLGEYNPNKESHFNGGDIQGLINKLDYIQGMGFTALWITPPVLNQWFSEAVNYGGYHGYWAKDFSRVDPHFGALSDYKRLADELHSRGMYLIQDIVVNHTGIFFGYEPGLYSAKDTSMHFKLKAKLDKATLSSQRVSPFFKPLTSKLSSKEQIFDRPSQSPFDKINLLNPEHAKSNIYNWTPEINNFDSVDQQHRYQLGGLADLNTKNEEVLQALKESYRFWITEVGVDAFRIDTVKYVEHEFWHRFLHDDDGIFAAANAVGKTNFLAFGEVFQFSEIKQNDGEKVLIKYLGNEDKPELNSVINFPLYKELGRVLAQGAPTSDLAYRLTQHVTMFPEPGIIPTFVDNHDTPRFLAGANSQAFKQAITVLFTVPGIPVIYQGSEQLLKETRQSMFAGGYLSEVSKFNTQSPMYQYLAVLNNLRQSYAAFTQGELQILATDEFGAGLLAYEMQHKDGNIIVLMNSAQKSIYTPAIRADVKANSTLDVLYSTIESPLTSQYSRFQPNSYQQIQGLLPPRSILILHQNTKIDTPNDKLDTPTFSKHLPPLEIEGLDNIQGKVFTESTRFKGKSNRPNAQLAFILDGDWDSRSIVETDSSGNWRYLLPVRDLGRQERTLSIFEQSTGSINATLRLVTEVKKASLSLELSDPKGDHLGPKNNYIDLQHSASSQQRDIRNVSIRSAGRNLSLAIKMQEVTDNWAPANGFDNVSFSIFIRDNKRNLTKQSHINALPLINAKMPINEQIEPNSSHWDFGHVAFGWGNYLFNNEGSSDKQRGQNLGIAPSIEVNKEAGTITFTYSGQSLDINDWNNVDIYISTWDIAGEGNYREISENAGLWNFGGGNTQSAKIADDVFISLGKAQP